MRKSMCLLGLVFLSWIGCNQPTPIFEQKDLFVKGKGDYHIYRHPAIVVTPNGTVLALCTGYLKRGRETIDADLLIRRSIDGGLSWLDKTVLMNEQPIDENRSDFACPILDYETDKVHLLFTRNSKQLFYTSSMDAGISFSIPVNLSHLVESVSFDWTRCTTSAGHGIQLKESGRLAAIIWFYNEKKEIYRSAAMYSDDHGKTWYISDLIATPDIENTAEGTLLQLMNGHLYANLRSPHNGYRAVSYSVNNAELWSAAELDKNLSCPNIHASIIRFTDTHTYEKNRILFTNPAVSCTTPQIYNQARKLMTVRISYDECKTWPVFKNVHTGPSGFSDLAVQNDKTILMFYERGTRLYYERLTFARYNLVWITKGKDRLNKK